LHQKTRNSRFRDELGLKRFILSADFGLVIGEGVFTDDYTQTADAGRSPHP
jgi:hypothetical protein